MIVSQPQPLHCSKCDHLWTGETLAHVAIDVWLAHIKSIHCPNCAVGWRKIGFVTDEAKVRAAVEARKAAQP
jgi:hypothetical protein